MKKLLLPALLVAGLFYSCQKENKSLITKPINHSRALSISNNGKYNVLGWGYDVTGQYGNANSAINPVINVAKFDSLNPNRVVFDNSTSQYVLANSGSNALGFSNNLKVSVKDTGSVFGLFKGSLNASFSDSYAFSSRFVYGYFNLMVQEQRIYFNTPESSLYSYLTPQFQQDVATQTPAYIVAHYGTHVLTDCTLGAKLEVLYRSETDNSNRSDAGALGVSAGISVLSVKGSVSANLSYGTAVRSKNFNQAYHYITHGGDPAKGLTNTLTFNGSTDTVVTLNVANWQNSVTVANSQLIDINQGTLIPIEDFVQDPNKAAALKAYVAQYLSGNAIQLLNDNYPSTTLYRFYNSVSGDHMESNNVGETSGLANWSLEGPQGQIYTHSEPGLVPLYRYNLNGYHFCTTNLSEIPNQQPEETVGYVDAQAGLGEIPIYRFNAKSGRPSRGHIYTTSQSEYNSLLNSGNWSYEGITGYISQ
jgi:hypothetical protein